MGCVQEDVFKLFDEYLRLYFLYIKGVKKADVSSMMDQ